MIEVTVEYPEIEGVRGEGLMIGVVLSRESKPIVATMMKHKVLANATAENVVRIVPPLNISREELQVVCDVLLQSIKENRK